MTKWFEKKESVNRNLTFCDIFRPVYLKRRLFSLIFSLFMFFSHWENQGASLSVNLIKHTNTSFSLDIWFTNIFTRPWAKKGCHSYCQRKEEEEEEEGEEEEECLVLDSLLILRDTKDDESKFQNNKIYDSKFEFERAERVFAPRNVWAEMCWTWILLIILFMNYWKTFHGIETISQW